MDNEKKIADLKADLNADTNPDLNIAETMAEGIPEHNTIDTIAAQTQNDSLVYGTKAYTSEPSAAENEVSSEALQTTGIPTTQPEETSQASSEYTPRHSSGMMVPVMELENSANETNNAEQPVPHDVSQTETATPASTLKPDTNPDINMAYTSEPGPYGYDRATQPETEYNEQNKETPVNNLVYGPIAPESNPYQDNTDYSITSDDWSNMKQQDAREYERWDKEDSKPRLHFENMAAEDDDDDDRPRKSGIKKSVIAALAIVTITGLGSLFFYMFEATQRKNEELKNFTMQVHDEVKYEYGKDVVLKAENFVENMDEMPEEIKKNYQTR